MFETALLAAVLLMSSTTACPGPTWSDPTDDPVQFATEPALDLVDTRIAFEPGLLVLELSFSSATAPTDLAFLAGFVDFDTDSSLFTGIASHVDQFGLVPPMGMGVDYYLLLSPGFDTAELFEAMGGVEESLVICPIEIDGTKLKVSVPRCGPIPCNGLVIGARFQLSVVVGNYDGVTDRAPNGQIPYAATPPRGDFDEDGDVDGDDIHRFRACSSGPSIPQADPGCQNADFDEDSDVDQEDFGLFQLSITGPC